MKTYLVTGGAGFIGSHLVDRLIADGHTVVVVDDFSAGREENLEQHNGNERLTVIKRSINDNLDDIFDKHAFDGIAHLAAIPKVRYSVEYPRESNHANVTGTLNMLETAKQHGIKRFVFYSSSSMYGDNVTLPTSEDTTPHPISPYALQKLTGQYYAQMYHRLYGMETIILCPFNVYGKRQDPDSAYAGHIPKFFKKFYQGEVPVINGDGEQTRDNTHTTDMVEATVKALETTNAECFGQAFNIGSGDNRSVSETTEMIRQIVGTDIKADHGPAVPESRHTQADVTKAKNMLGFEPHMSYEQGLKDTSEYYKQFKK